MNIVSIIEAFQFSPMGGAGRVFWELNRHLATNGHRVDAIFRNNGDIKNFSPPPGVHYHFYPGIKANQVKSLVYYNRSVQSLLKECIKDNIPDLLIIHSSSVFPGIAKVIKNLSLHSPDFRSVYFFHSPWNKEYELLLNPGLNLFRTTTPVEPNTSFFLSPGFTISEFLSLIRKYFDRYALSNVWGIVTLSRYMQKLMLEIHPRLTGEGDKIVLRKAVIPGGVDIDKFFPCGNESEKKILREKLYEKAIAAENQTVSNISNICKEKGCEHGKDFFRNAFIVMTVRRLVPRTGVDILISAFMKAYKSGSLSDNIILVIVGDGPLINELKIFLGSEPEVRNRVIFTGFVDDDTLPSYYRSADLFVMPTRTLEGFGLSTVEAMACGVPVIGTNVGGIPEILRTISDDLLIPECSVEAISRKLIKSATPEFANRFRRRCMESVKENFTWEKHTAKLLDFVRQPFF